MDYMPSPTHSYFKAVKNKTADNIYDLQTQRFIPHQMPADQKKQNLRQETIPLGCLSEVFFKVNTEAEV